MSQTSTRLKLKLNWHVVKHEHEDRRMAQVSLSDHDHDHDHDQRFSNGLRGMDNVMAFAGIRVDFDLAEWRKLQGERGAMVRTAASMHRTTST